MNWVKEVQEALEAFISAEDGEQMSDALDKAWRARAAIPDEAEELWTGKGMVEYDEITELYDIDTEDVYVTLSAYTPIALKDGQQVKITLSKEMKDE